MSSAMFLGGSALFMTLYVLIAEQFGILGEATIEPINPDVGPD